MPLAKKMLPIDHNVQSVSAIEIDMGRVPAGNPRESRGNPAGMGFIGSKPAGMVAPHAVSLGNGVKANGKPAVAGRIKRHSVIFIKKNKGKA